MRFVKGLPFRYKMAKTKVTLTHANLKTLKIKTIKCGHSEKCKIFNSGMINRLIQIYESFVGHSCNC